jgi:uncharacterized membrane protein YfcA
MHAMITTLLSLLFGALIGLTLGMVGGGGSILTVPILVYAIGQPVRQATTTALAIVGLNALVGMVGHARAHRVDLRTGIAFGLTGIGGAVVGSWFNARVPGRVLLIAFAVIMLVAAVAMLRRRSPASEDEATVDANGIAWGKVLASGTAIGLMTGFFGVGGGFVIVPALVLVLGLPMRTAVGTSLLIIAMNALWSLLAHLRFGRMDLGVVGLFVLGGVAGALAGVYVAGRVPQRRLTQGFAALITAVAGYMLLRSTLGVG